MLEDSGYQKYYARMKNKQIIFSTISLLLSGLFLAPNFCAAETELPPIIFSAINAGYKDDTSSQNYDFIELKRNTEEPLDLSNYRIVYFNSSDKEAGTISFENQALSGERLVLGYSKSPQFSEAPNDYRYVLSSSGLASTAGRLVLMADEEVIDELCWGKTICENSLPKFATKSENNLTAVLCEGDECEEEYQFIKYYPDINPDALIPMEEPEPELESESEPEPEPEPERVSCAGLTITELFGYYNDASSEQFVELSNATSNPIRLDGCRLNYKNKDYPISGTINNGEYLAVWGVPLAKNPSKDQTIQLLDDNGVVDSANYPHGQKKGTAMARFGDDWSVTFAPTPSAENIFQEFRSCPEGKMINPETGNCVNKPVAATAKTCQAGYYLNPATGRCKKNEVATTKECAEGYERNPETGRCRKVYKNTAQEYPVEQIEQGSYDNPRIFIAVGAIVLLGTVAAVYVVWQFREEIRKLFRLHFRRKRRLS